MKALQHYVKLSQPGHPPGTSETPPTVVLVKTLQLFVTLCQPGNPLDPPPYVKVCKPEHPPVFIENPSTLGQSLQAWESSSDLVTSLQLNFTLR